MKLKPVIYLLVFLSCNSYLQAQSTAFLQNDTLVLQNEKIRLSYLWNEGALMAIELADKNTGHSFRFSGSEPGVNIADNIEKPISADLKVERHLFSPLMPAHWSATIETNFGQWQLRRIFRIYPDAPAIGVEYYFRGEIPWEKMAGGVDNDSHGVEREVKRTAEVTRRMEMLAIQGNHWRLKAVEFNDDTDRNNNLVHEKTIFIYRSPIELQGNVFLAEELISGNRFFIVKESPLDEKQLHYPGYDVRVQAGKLEIAGIGLRPEDVSEGAWTRGYGYAIGVGGNTNFTALKGLRDYLKAKAPVKDQGSEMIMANTWGDRSRDQRMNSKFVLQELEAGSNMGITHLQLDDGWQAGLSKNSGSDAGKLWELWDKESWQPHPERFPDGLEPIVKRAEELEIQLGLWFHPSSEDSFANWSRDADIIVELYRKYGIRYFKMDGIEIPDKEADKNLRLLFESAKKASKGNIFFNLDATAGRRTGYFYMNDFGNIFLENRYTDWGNYYPSWTLRNLWMLSRYVPVENLQVEFLNKWRNEEQYPAKDPLAPKNYSFDYLFAITMMAQPLAWMELSSLPKVAFSIAPIMEEYAALMDDIHEGTILPIGQVPTGFSWTGFQSVNHREGYFLIFREAHDEDNFRMRTWLKGEQKVRLTPLFHSEDTIETETSIDGTITFSIEKQNNFQLYKYEILENISK